MPLKPIETLLPNLVRKEHRSQALTNWELIAKHLAEASEENKRAVVATVLLETAGTFAPIREYGENDYFIRHYWLNPNVRKMLGNQSEHDAYDYCGRGFIQLTGRANYEKAGGALNLPLLSQPQLLLQPEPSARACAWFWNTHGLPELIAQVGKYKDAPSRERVWRMVRMRVNGGTNGLLSFLSHLEALGVK